MKVTETKKLTGLSQWTLLNLLLLLSTQLFSQPFDLKEKIPFDPATSKGVLSNGLTYYVKSNATPKNRAEMMLVVSGRFGRGR